MNNLLQAQRTFFLSKGMVCNAIYPNDLQAGFSLPSSYPSMLEDIKRKIKEAPSRALASAHPELLAVYEVIGKTMDDQQQAPSGSNPIVKQVAKDLQNSFPGAREYSSCNLSMMKNLYISDDDRPKLQTLSAEISWSHPVLILGKCKDFLEPEFDMRMSKRNGWTYRAFMHQSENKTDEKTMLSPTNFEKNLPEKMVSKAKLAVKDEYVFPFLEVGDDPSEYELEQAMISKIEDKLPSPEQIALFLEYIEWEGAKVL